MNNDDKVLVLFSGGQDSTTCLAVALSKHKNVEALGFDYGQRHQIELTQAKSICEKVKVPFTVLDMRFVTQLSPNALTHHDIQIENEKNNLPNTFVPGRNLLFLTVAASYAYSLDIRTIYTGVCQTDFSGYPDCREAFIRSAEESISLAMDSLFKIETPLMHLTKAETVKLMHQLGQLDLYGLSHTCYEGKRPPCGKCPACLLRAKGFEEARITDPLTRL